MTLSLVIPVWDDPAGLTRLLRQVQEMGVFAQVIVVDDASKTPCTPESLGFDPATYGPELVYARNAQRRGAGYARNRGLKKVRSSHVLFFDSDDVFTPDFTALLADLEGREDFDFCIFRHVDSRVRAAGGHGPLASDDALWARAGVTAPLQDLSPEGATVLCRIAAYPWNKIYRTAFLRDNAIRCTELMVHNDIEIHWTSFLHARRILASHRVCCEHFVTEGASRLTNRAGAERLEVFRALSNVLDGIETDPDALRFLEPFTAFYLGLFRWIGDVVAPDLRSPFAARAQHFLASRITLPLYTLLALRNPDLGARINTLLRTPAR